MSSDHLGRQSTCLACGSLAYAQYCQECLQAFVNEADLDPSQELEDPSSGDESDSSQESICLEQGEAVDSEKEKPIIEDVELLESVRFVKAERDLLLKK